jgi:radical SAM-linked protein
MNRLLFTKTGMAKYISHLDLMRTMQRALLRAGLEIKHTQGFNPHPHMVFALPLPVGCESLCELMDFELVKDVPADEIVPGLNRTLPEGIEFERICCREKAQGDREA